MPIHHPERGIIQAFRIVAKGVMGRAFKPAKCPVKADQPLYFCARRHATRGPKHHSSASAVTGQNDLIAPGRELLGDLGGLICLRGKLMFRGQAIGGREDPQAGQLCHPRTQGLMRPRAANDPATPVKIEDISPFTQLLRCETQPRATGK